MPAGLFAVAGCGETSVSHRTRHIADRHDRTVAQIHERIGHAFIIQIYPDTVESIPFDESREVENHIFAVAAEFPAILEVNLPQEPRLEREGGDRDIE